MCSAAFSLRICHAVSGATRLITIAAIIRSAYALDGGGPFIQQASHNIDTYLWFFGMPEKVTSQLGTFAHQIEVEYHGAAILRYGNGMIGTIIASTCTYPGYPARLKVICERGTFTTVDDRITVWEIDGVDNPSVTPEKPLDAGASSAVVTDTSRHENLLKDFEASRCGRRQACDRVDLADLWQVSFGN